MIVSIFKTEFPPSLSKYMIALHADLRGSTQTKKYPVSDPQKYNLLKQNFKSIGKSLHEEGRFILTFKCAEQGDNLDVAFFNPWPDVAIVSALHFALCLHKEIIEHDFDHHGVAIGIHLGEEKIGQDINTVESYSFTRASRMATYVGEIYPRNYETKIFISKEVHELLPSDFQQFFMPLGKQNIAKEGHEAMMMELYEFQNDKIDSVVVAIDSFFKNGLIGILTNGLCPHKDIYSKGVLDFLKYMVNSAHREIKILQTYIPYIDDFKTEIRNAIQNRKVSVKILLLNPYWKTTPQITNLLKDVCVCRYIPKNKKFRSPLAFQRGVDFDYPTPLEFNAQIQTCAATLTGITNRLNLQEKIYKYYNATPSVCLHLFDDILFVGHFLQRSYAVATPHLILFKSPGLFDLYMKEFDILWERAND